MDEQQTNPTRAALQWLAQAMNDYSATMAPAVRQAFVARAQGAINQVNVALLPPPTGADPAPQPRRGRPPKDAPPAEPAPQG